MRFSTVVGRVGSVLLGGSAFVAPASGQFVIGGPAAPLTLNSGTWSWDGGISVSPFRTALSDPTLFGPGAAVSETLQTVNLPVVDAQSLANLDAFVAMWWKDTDTPAAAVPAVVNWFLAGGHLILFQDSNLYDAIGEALGVPTFAASNGSLSNGAAPFFDGPFGMAAGVAQWGSTGQLDAGQITLRNGHVGATNAAGEVTAAYWNAGEYQPGAGRLVILADVDMVSVNTASFAPLNDNGRFGLNAVAFAAGIGSNVRAYGDGCAGSGGFVPQLVAFGDATPGTSFGLKVQQALGGSVAMLLFGANEASIPIGLSGCSLLVSPLVPFQPVVPLGGLGPGNGTFTLVAAMPLSASGLVFTHQVLTADPQALAGFASTGGLEVTVP